MTDRKRDDCSTLYTICLTVANNEHVETFQAFVKNREKKASFTKSQTINKIISEWAEDRHLTLEVGRKNEKYKPTEDRLEELKQLRFLKAKYPEE